MQHIAQDGPTGWARAGADAVDPVGEHLLFEARLLFQGEPVIEKEVELRGVLPRGIAEIVLADLRPVRNGHILGMR